MSGTQKGIALVLAILVVALVSIISMQMITDRQLQIYRAENLYFRSQAKQFALGVERWALGVITQDYLNDKQAALFIDSEHDLWNTVLMDLDVEDAVLDSQIFDLQGRFNLNNLVNDGKLQAQWLLAYKRLLTTLELPEDLAESLQDWIDSDEIPTGSYGAEDVYYMSQDVPYRASNQPLVHLSELLLIKGYNSDVYQILKPYVYVAPETTSVNINTTTAAVLQAIIKGITKAQSETILSQVKTTAYTSVEELLKADVFKDKAVEPGFLTVASDYFVINSRVNIDKTSMSLQSVMHRNQQGISEVISRQESFVYEKMKGV